MEKLWYYGQNYGTIPKTKKLPFMKVNQPQPPKKKTKTKTKTKNKQTKKKNKKKKQKKKQKHDRLPKTVKL